MRTIVGVLALAAIVLTAQLVSPTLARQGSGYPVALPYGELSPEVRLLMGRLCNDRVDPKSSIVGNNEINVASYREDIARMVTFGIRTSSLHY